MHRLSKAAFTLFALTMFAASCGGELGTSLDATDNGTSLDAAGDACTPDCAERECGDDGCGGSCGSCAVGCSCSSTGVCTDCIEPIDIDVKKGCNPLSTSDMCILPYPSFFYEDEDTASPTGVRVHYPEDAIPIPDGVPGFNMDPTNAADGVSPAGPILVHFGKDVAPGNLNTIHELGKSLASSNPIAIIDMETGKRVVFMSEMDMNRRDDYPGRYALIIRPMEPMTMGHRHVAVLTRDLTDADGIPLESPPAFAALRDEIPTTNTEIEAVRNHFEGLFGFLKDHGYARDDLLLAWDFSVASSDFLLGSILSMREKALAEMKGKGLAYTITKVEDDPNENLAKLVEGDFEVPTFLRADNTFDYDADHHPVRQAENLSFHFTMIIP
ncbi:MAG: hypothetical protein GXP54_12010, partial [Deltaproteobacteria bacterium]|nr:hypothetical protein [Deltaproteobacteria bacterium]